MKKVIGLYKGFKPFTEEEAWVIFRLAAFAEAIGWTLLIIGIVLTDYVFHSRVPVVLAGRTHGIFFGLYVTAVLTLAPSLGWKWEKTIIAGLFSVPPYGTLAFEIWASHTRQRKNLGQLARIAVYIQGLSVLRK